MIRARERPSSHAPVTAVAVAVLAFYMRYGVVTGLAAMALAAALTWGPRGWPAPRRLAAAAALGVLGMLPHLVYSERIQGSPVAVLLDAGNVVHGEYVGDGLVYYA